MDNQLPLYKFESPHPMGHSCQVWFHLSVLITGEDSNVKKLKDNRWRKLNDIKAANGLWQDELKMHITFSFFWYHIGESSK